MKQSEAPYSWEQIYLFLLEIANTGAKMCTVCLPCVCDSMHDSLYYKESQVYHPLQVKATLMYNNVEECLPIGGQAEDVV